MFSQYMKTLTEGVSSLHGETAGPVYLIPGGDARPFGNILRRLRTLFAEIDRKRRVEYENRQAIAHLESLSDAQLRDIGIVRHEIAQRVRLGREAI